MKSPKRSSRPSRQGTAKYFFNDDQSKAQKAAPVKMIKSRWYGSKTRYRFMLDTEPPHQMTVEWSGEKPKGSKSFIAKYRMHRDSFLRDALPEGFRSMVVCPASGTCSIIEGTGRESAL